MIVDQERDPAVRTVDILAAFLTAPDRSAADPYGAVTALGDLLLRTFSDSPDATALLTRFQQEPRNPGVQSAIRGRISEALLDRPEFAAQLQAALARITVAAPVPAWPQQQPTVQQTHSVGNVAAVSGNTGRVSLKQRTIKIGRLHVPVPIFALVLLLGGGALFGGGVAVINSGNSDAGEYAFYAEVAGDKPELSYFRWTTHKDGSLTGEAISYKAGSLTDAIPVPLAGHQDGNKVNFTATFLVSVNLQGTINGDTLTIQGMSGEGLQTETLHRTTPEKFNQILADYKARHPGTRP